MSNNLTTHLKQLFGDTPIVIWGMGREGRSTLAFLQQQLPDHQLIVTDTKPLDLPEYLPPEKALTSKAIVFKSPGISPFTAPITPPFWSNTRLFLELLQLQRSHWPVTTIGVTGTKGKSTTSALLHHTLQHLGYPAWLGGNIGRPPLDLLAEIERHFVSASASSSPNFTPTPDADLTATAFVVLELSSHQLLDTTHSPNIAVIQALSPEHLDYYPDTTTYYAAKKRILTWQQPDDYVLFNADSDTTVQLVSQAQSQKIGYSIQPSNSNPHLGAVVGQGQIWFKDQAIFDIANSPLLGQHNLYNLLPSVVVAALLGHSVPQIASAIQDFKPLSHRLEPVAEVDGVLYVNDSMSTTPEATQAALAAFPDRPVVLIAGGYERHQDYSQLATQIVQQQVSAVLAFPTTGQRLLDQVATKAQELSQATPQLELTPDMSTAVTRAKQLVPPHGVVLLSPGAASFNLFRDFADRGDQFRDAVVSSPLQ